MPSNLFIGIELATDVQDKLNELIANVSPGHDKYVEWTKPGKWHITLAFLGKDCEYMRTHAKNAMLSLSDVPRPGFTVNIRQLGCFGAPSSPRILWAGVEESEPLRSLHRALNDALTVPSDYPTWIPHVTVAKTRLRAGCPGLAQIHRVLGAGFYAGTTSVTNVKLYLTTPNGYQCLERVDLQ